jgi:hyperosmotically inducible protein
MKSRLLLLVSACAFALLATACAQSDAGITTSVKSQLGTDDTVKARRIDVDTRDRVVTLTGEVRTQEEESRALQIARKTDGVRDVVDNLSVVPEPDAMPTSGMRGTPAEPAGGAAYDGTITASVKSKLLADPETSGLRIDVDTKEQIVTLTGKVASEAEKREALTIARGVDGVKSVIDRLTVEPRQ